MVQGCCIGLSELPKYLLQDLFIELCCPHCNSYKLHISLSHFIYLMCFTISSYSVSESFSLLFHLVAAFTKLQRFSKVGHHHMNEPDTILIFHVVQAFNNTVISCSSSAFVLYTRYFCYFLTSCVQLLFIISYWTTLYPLLQLQEASMKNYILLHV